MFQKLQFSFSSLDFLHNFFYSSIFCNRFCHPFRLFCRKFWVLLFSWIFEKLQIGCWSSFICQITIFDWFQYFTKFSCWPFLTFNGWLNSITMAACSVCTYTIRLNEVQVNYNFFSDLMLLMNIAPLARTYTVLALRCLQMFALSQSKYSYSWRSFSAGGESNHASESRTNKQVLKEKQQFLSTSIWKVQGGRSKDLFLRNIIHKLLYMERHHGYRHWIEISHENHRLHFLVPIISNDILQVVFKDALDAFLKKRKVHLHKKRTIDRTIYE